MKDWLKFLKVVFHGLMALVALLALVVALFIGRLMYGPLTTTYLTPWVEHAFSQPKYGVRAKVAQSMLHWDRERRQIVLDLNGVQFVDPLDQKVADVPQIVAIFSPLGYFDESHAPWIINIRHPQLHLRIDGDGILRLGALQAGDANILEKEEDTPITADAVRGHLKELAKGVHHAAFGLFSNFTVEDASIALIDETRNEGWHFKIPLLAIKRVGRDQQGSAAVKITKQNKETNLDLNLRYSAAEKLFHAVLSFKDVEPTMLTAERLPVRVPDYITSTFSGAVTIVFDNDLNIKTGLINLVLGPGQLIVKDYYPEPLPIKSLSLNGTYTSATQILRLEPYALELEKALLSGSAQIHFSHEASTVSAQLKLSNLQLEDLPLYWPENVAVNPRRWILANMQKGLAEEATANVQLSLPKNDVENAQLDRLGGTISLKDVDLRYWKPLPLLNKVSATSTYDTNQFDIQVKGGEMGAIKLKPSHVVIRGLSGDMQYADIEAHLEGPAQQALKVLNLPPLGYADKMKVDPNLVSGKMEGVLKTSFPLLDALKLEEMGISASVKLEDLGIKKIVDFLTITNGAVGLNVDVKNLSIDGDAAINGIPAHVRWDEKFSPEQGETLSHGVATATTGAEAAKKFGVEFDVSSDPMPITVVYDRYPDLSRLSVNADAKGAKLHISDIGYSKPAGAPANLGLALEWGGSEPPRLPKIDMTGDRLNVKGHGNFDVTGKKLQKLTLDPFVAGRSKAKIDFVRGADNVPHWTVSGEAIDIQGLLTPERENTGEKKVVEQVQATGGDDAITPLRLDLKADRVLTGEKTELGSTVIKGVRDEKGWASLNISTVAAGQTPFNFSLAPVNGVTVVEGSTPNLGNLMKSLDVTDTIVGGKLSMDGKSGADATRNIFGHIKITDFQVKEMPFLVKLLSAISPDGLLVLGQQSLRFAEFNSEYLWKPEEFVFTKANTGTGTLGLTAAGKISLAQNSIDLQGQVIPVYFISKIIGAIPVIGDILTGGEGGGLFAATYTVKGPLAKPEMSVNPVSVLAPGIIRDILFTDPNITKDKKPVAVPTTPKKL